MDVCCFNLYYFIDFFSGFKLFDYYGIDVYVCKENWYKYLR